jgi:hypothetical protein
MYLETWYKEPPMTPQLHSDIRLALIRAQAFESNDGVRALFTDPRLQPWRSSVPEAGNPAARASLLLGYLHDRANVQGQKALALLLQVLGEQESGALAATLLALAPQVDPSLQAASGPATRPVNETTTRLPDHPTTRPRDDYTTFDLHISPGGHVVASSPQGAASADIGTDVPAAIATAVRQVEDRTTSAAGLKELGEQLFRWLFPEAIDRHLGRAEAVAREKGEKLRIRLRVEAPAIASLPLEFLYWPERGHYFAVNPHTALSRYLNVTINPNRVRPRPGPLHMLAIIADASDLPRLNPDEWEEILLHTLQGPLDDNQLTLETVKTATRREITRALLKQPPDIVQFIGHGVYQHGTAHIALVDQFSGESWLLDDERFAGLFAGYDDNLALISLATCESGASGDPQGFSGLAPRLQQRGIPAVLAMQYKVYVKTARVVLEDFYTALAARKPLDWAIQQARNAVALDFGADNREFATPILYLRSDSGYVFGE